MTTETSTRIKSFVDGFWPIPFSFDPTQEVESQIASHHALLQRTFGEAAFGEFKESLDTYLASPSEDTHQDLSDMMLKHNMNEALPEIYERSKLCLRHLLQTLEDSPPERSIDLGSGDGRIPIGLATYFPSIKRIYAVDLSPYAKDCLEKNIGVHAPAVQDDLRKAIIPVEKDYEDEEVIRRIQEENQGLFDVVITCNPLLAGSAIRSAGSLLSRKGKFLCYTALQLQLDGEMDLSPCGLQQIEEEYWSGIEEYAEEFNLRLTKWDSWAGNAQQITIFSCMERYS